MKADLTAYIKIIIRRFHLLWILFYLLLIGSSFAVGANFYEKYNQNQFPSGNIDFLVSKTRYQLGETIEFTVVNHFSTTIYVTNQCPQEPLNVYRWQNEKWVQIHDTDRSEDSECHTQERDVGISPESSRSYDFDDWPNLFQEPGIYRIAVTVDHLNDVLFQDFTILAPAEVIEVENETLKKETPIEIIQEQKPEPEENIYNNREKYENEDEDEEDDD